LWPFWSSKLKTNILSFYKWSAPQALINCSFVFCYFKVKFCKWEIQYDLVMMVSEIIFCSLHFQNLVLLSSRKQKWILYHNSPLLLQYVLIFCACILNLLNFHYAQV
jgi:hypothetical protein